MTPASPPPKSPPTVNTSLDGAREVMAAGYPPPPDTTSPTDQPPPPYVHQRPQDTRGGVRGCDVAMGTHLAVAAIQFLVAQMSNTVPLFEEHTRKLDEVVATYPDNAGVKQVVTVLKAQMALEFWKDYQTWEAGKDNLERDRVDVAARYPENLAEFDELYWQWQHYITSAKDLMGQPAAAYEDCEKIQRSPGQTTLSFGNLGGAGERFAQLDREFADKRRQNIVEMQASLAQLIMSNPEMASAVYGRQQTSSNS